MKNGIKIAILLLLSGSAVLPVQAQRSKKKRTKARTHQVIKKIQPARPAAKTETADLQDQPADTSRPRMVTITSEFKPFLKDAAKVNFTAASPVLDSSKIPVSYNVPSQNLFFTYQPVPIKPLALAVDTGFSWENHHYIKVGAGNFSSYMGEVGLSFGDGQHSITNIKGNFLTATGHLPAQQAAKWGVEVLSVFHTGNAQEWTVKPYYESNVQYFYGYQPSSLNYAKDQIKQQYSTVGIDASLQNKAPNEFGITYHPRIQAYRFFDNREAYEHGFKLDAPLEKWFGKIYALHVGLMGDISSASFPRIPNSLTIKNNLYSINPSIYFHTPNVQIEGGILPSWDNTHFYMLPDISAQMKIAGNNLSIIAGWKGYFQKNSFRNLAGYNPFISYPDSMQNTRNLEQYAGVKITGGDHISFLGKVSLLHIYNQVLYLNDKTDGSHFQTLYEPDMQALRLHAEFSYTEQERISFLAGATYSHYQNLSVQQKAWGIPPLELNASLKWKLLKDLQLSSELYVMSGNPYQDNSGNAHTTSPIADLNAGVEFTVVPRLNLWLQMKNLLNTEYQRWNQYTVLGFNVLGGVVYSFR